MHTDMAINPSTQLQALQLVPGLPSPRHAATGPADLIKEQHAGHNAQGGP